MSNPAQHSPLLAQLFPAGIATAELTHSASREVLTSSELQAISHCAPKRIDDFTRGRACAHKVLAALDIHDFSILSGKTREPLWPEGIVGSITHTNGFAAAVAARASEVGGLGIDCEVFESVHEDLWQKICTPSEQQRLAELPEEQRRRLAGVIFAAKEAFYKCQFPVTHEWVGFEDVSIEPLHWPANEGSVRVVPEVPLPLSADRVKAVTGRFHFREQWVIAGLILPLSPTVT